ncbi:MAG: lantibiotic dehydratase, partial [Bacteroidetes bacterium]|nr:lantibiotic dehydratase [Bacteroidota bacterium]
TESRIHVLASASKSIYLDKIIDAAKSGASVAELIDSIVTEDISKEDAIDFINEMIEECLLITELEPRVTGTEYHTQVLTNIQQLRQASEFHRELENIINQLSILDKHGIGSPIEVYKPILSRIKEWGLNFDAGKLLQCDLYKPTEKALLSDVVTDELNKAINLLAKITPTPTTTNLLKFKEEFIKKYESEEISLLEALDPETGIGYPANEQGGSDNSPLLEGLFFRQTLLPQQPAWNPDWTGYLFGKLEESLKTKSREVEIKDIELEKIFRNKISDEKSLPDSAYTLCNVFSKSNFEIDRDNFLLFHAITSGPSAGNLLGRFCFVDKKIKEFVETTLCAEESIEPDKIFAEILHIPEARLGNILNRPTMRKYEISLLTRPSVEEDHTITLNDLMVSVRNNKVVLRSKKFEKEVIPRLTTAHNFSLNPIPHYHFLCDLQFQNIKAVLSWDWGFLNQFSYLPRVRYGKTILSKARWSLKIHNLTNDKNIQISDLQKKLISYFIENEIPDIVTISEGDNQLPINIRQEHCQKILAQELIKQESIFLHECLFNTENLIVQNGDSMLTNEIIVPWIKPRPKSSDTNGSALVTGIAGRVFTPGQKWQYIKIYCGVKSADTILTDYVKKFVEQLTAKKILEKFFFIRYADPDHHLRLRFLGSSALLEEITKFINNELQPLVELRLIWKIQADTYVREIERYGENNIEVSESLFFHDSLASLEILSMLDGDHGDKIRWQFAIKGVNDMLDSFGLNLNQKHDLMQKLAQGFASEFEAENSDVKKQLSNKFRAERENIEMMFNTITQEHEYYPVWQVFEKRKIKITECAEQIVIASGDSKLHSFDLLASYSHMFINRFMRSKQRIYELVIYDVIAQYFRSLIARAKSGIEKNR